MPPVREDRDGAVLHGPEVTRCRVMTMAGCAILDLRASERRYCVNFSQGFRIGRCRREYEHIGPSWRRDFRVSLQEICETAQSDNETLSFFRLGIGHVNHSLPL